MRIGRSLVGSDIPCLAFCKSWSKMRSCCSCRLAWISSLVGASWTIFCLLREFASAPRDGLLPIFRIVKKKVLASFAGFVWAERIGRPLRSSKLRNSAVNLMSPPSVWCLSYREFALFSLALAPSRRYPTTCIVLRRVVSTLLVRSTNRFLSRGGHSTLFFDPTSPRRRIQ